MSHTMGFSPGTWMETHDVLPPYRTVDGPWHGVEPRTPWNVTRMSVAPTSVTLRTEKLSVNSRRG